MKRIEDSLRGLWDNIRCTNLQIIGVPEDQKEKESKKKIFEEIIGENLPNMRREQCPNCQNNGLYTYTHIYIYTRTDI